MFMGAPPAFQGVNKILTPFIPDQDERLASKIVQAPRDKQELAG